MINPLDRKRVTGLIDEIPTTGHSPLKVFADDGNTYFLKNIQGKLPAYELASEIICYYLLNLWKIPTPQLTILQVNTQDFKDDLKRFTNRHKLTYYEVPSVGSLALASPVFELNSLTEPTYDLDIQNLANPDDLWKIAIFDIWVENDDRKPSNPNLLLQITQKGTKIYALDHAFTFLTLDYKHLKPEWGISQGFNDNILETDLAKELYKIKAKDEQFRKEVQQFFTDNVVNCKNYMDEILKNIPLEFGLDVEDHQSITNFLFDENRRQQVEDYFFEHLDEYA